MAETEPDPQIRIAVLSPLAAWDLAENYLYTKQTWGVSQAEKYTAFLRAEIENVLNNLNLGRPIQDRPERFSHFAKWGNAKNGHYIVFRRTQSGIYVLRILHSAMDLANHISSDVEF